MKESEDLILSQCHTWLWNTYPELRYKCWHVANERTCSAKEGAILKAKGVVSGVPDYVINHKCRSYYIEFKTDTGKLSDNQKKIINALKNDGFDVEIIRSVGEFMDCVKKILET